MNPFDLAADITNGKVGLITKENAKDYNAFMVNKILSYYPDTLLYAQQMNEMPHLPLDMQYDYLMGSIKKKKRWAKWNKKEKSTDLLAVATYYNTSYRIARQYLAVLTDDQLKVIRDTVAEMPK